jgi:hypothetical protein
LGLSQDIENVNNTNSEGELIMFFGKKHITMNSESKFTLKVGHDRNGILIIKELSVKADNVDELIEKTQEALAEFNQMKFNLIAGEMTE